MTLRAILMILLVFAIAGCDTAEKKKKKQAADRRKDMADQAGDMSFQAFVNVLGKAVAQRDRQMLASMMTPDFGFRLEPTGEGAAGAFQYWDSNNLWQELQVVLSQKFAPKSNFMVAPQQFSFDPNYNGYRAGVTLVNGSWKFAYFVKE